MDRFERELTDLYPALRNFAYKLAGKKHAADDLVQETMLKALANRDSFEIGTNLRSWTFTIMRNHFYTESVRKSARGHVSFDDPVCPIPEIGKSGNQLASLEVTQTLEAISTLSGRYAAVLAMMGIGMTYEEVAERMQLPLGTIKSRVSRGRAALERKLNEPPRPREESFESRTVVPFLGVTSTPRAKRAITARPVVLPQSRMELLLPVQGPLETLRSLGCALRVAETRANGGFRLRTFVLG